MPVVLATWEAEACGLLELRGSGLHSAVLIRCPCYVGYQYGVLEGALEFQVV